MSDRCQSCGADIVFVRSAKDIHKRMILNANPEKRVVIFDSWNRGYVTVPTNPDAAGSVVDTYVDHHVTCPKAADWKGRTR
jgi:hypothetical protein